MLKVCSSNSLRKKRRDRKYLLYFLSVSDGAMLEVQIFKI
jgi:hypothetical protein